jgi:hypothetical protein
MGNKKALLPALFLFAALLPALFAQESEAASGVTAALILTYQLSSKK